EGTPGSGVRDTGYGMGPDPLDPVPPSRISHLVSRIAAAMMFWRAISMVMAVSLAQSGAGGSPEDCCARAGERQEQERQATCHHREGDNEEGRERMPGDAGRHGDSLLVDLKDAPEA